MATTYTNMSLKSWNAAADIFSYTDLDSNWSKIDVHDHSVGKGVAVARVAANVIDSSNIIDGSIVNADINASAGIVGTKLAANTVTNDKIATADLQKLGLSDSTIRRGKSIISGTGTRTNTAYGALDAGAAQGPDQVASVVLPTDGLICVAFQATWQESVSGAARAAIFIGANQLKIANYDTISTTTSSDLQDAYTNSGPINLDTPLSSHPLGLQGVKITGTAYGGDATTGQLVGLSSAAGSQYETGSLGSPGRTAPGGGPCYVFASAGTYTVSVQFKATSGTVTVKNRKLWVWTMAF